jgi:hypothetical protein
VIFISLEIIYLGLKHSELLCEECKIKMEEHCCIYLIISKVGSAYFVFVSTFYVMTRGSREIL